VSPRCWHSRADGRSNAEIAPDLGLNLKTAQNQGSNVPANLQLRERTQAALRLRGLGGPRGDRQERSRSWPPS
jgi:DNA-binding NarL/FixJ family response regulator